MQTNLYKKKEVLLMFVLGVWAGRGANTWNLDYSLQGWRYKGDGQFWGDTPYKNMSETFNLQKIISLIGICANIQESAAEKMLNFPARWQNMFCPSLKLRWRDRTPFCGMLRKPPGGFAPSTLLAGRWRDAWRLISTQHTMFALGGKYNSTFYILQQVLSYRT